jgi:copper chaperone CopZ
MPTLVLSIQGMTCGHCVRAASDAILKVPGVTQADVSLDLARAEITHDGASVEEIIAALKAEDFTGSVA